MKITRFRIVGIIPFYKLAVVLYIVVNGFVRHIKPLYLGHFAKFRRDVTLRNSIVIAYRFARVVFIALCRIVFVHEIIGIVIMISYIHVKSRFSRVLYRFLIFFGYLAVFCKIAIILR